MLTPLQKASILRKNGFAVPEAPPEPDLEPRSEPGSAMQAWHRAIESLFVIYAAARAAKSLRDAQEKSQLEHLRQLAHGGPTLARFPPLRTQRA